MDRCRCGRIKDMDGDDHFQLNHTIHTSTRVQGNRAFCGPTDAHQWAAQLADKIDELKATVEQLEQAQPKPLAVVGVKDMEHIEGGEQLRRDVVWLLVWRCPVCKMQLDWTLHKWWQMECQCGEWEMVIEARLERE